MLKGKNSAWLAGGLINQRVRSSTLPSRTRTRPTEHADEA